MAGEFKIKSDGRLLLNRNANPVVDGGDCQCCPPESTGCCFPDGHCEDLDPPTCVLQGGVSQPDPCEDTECPQPATQACCIELDDDAFDCQDLTPEDCIAVGGEPQGARTECVTTQCGDDCYLPALFCECNNGVQPYELYVVCDGYPGGSPIFAYDGYCWRIPQSTLPIHVPPAGVVIDSVANQFLNCTACCDCNPCEIPDSFCQNECGDDINVIIDGLNWTQSTSNCDSQVGTVSLPFTRNSGCLWVYDVTDNCPVAVGPDGPIWINQGTLGNSEVGGECAWRLFLDFIPARPDPFGPELCPWANCAFFTGIINARRLIGQCDCPRGEYFIHNTFALTATQVLVTS